MMRTIALMGVMRKTVKILPGKVKKSRLLEVCNVWSNKSLKQELKIRCLVSRIMNRQDGEFFK